MENEKFNSIEEFASELAQRIRQAMYDQHGLVVEAESHLANKTNDVDKQGITVHFEGSSDMAPTVYVEDAFDQFNDGIRTFEEIVNGMTSAIYDARLNQPELPEFTADEAKKHITLTLVNTAMNQELLSKTPHFEILGGELSAIPRWYLDENASFVVHNDLCGSMGLTPDEVLKIGMDHINSQHFEARPLQDILAEMMGGDFMDMPPMDGPQMIVLSSENRIQGANALLSEDALNDVYEMLGCQYVILPSSIHELLCLPLSEDVVPDELRSMVHEVNLTQVAPEERLSDNVFFYDGIKLSVVRDGFGCEEQISAEPVVTRSAGMAI